MVYVDFGIHEGKNEEEVEEVAPPKAKTTNKTKGT
jgi:hypothetical protein